MKYANLGSSNLRVSEVCLGTSERSLMGMEALSIYSHCFTACASAAPVWKSKLALQPMCERSAESSA